MLGLFLLFAISAFGQTSTTITTSGSWVVPVGVTSIQVEAWGGGGGGGGTASVASKSGGGGSGGCYVKHTTIAVTPGESLTITIGAGGTGGVGSGSVTQSVDGGSSSVARSATTLIRAGGGIKGIYLSAGGAGTGGLAVTTDNSGFEGSFSYKGGDGANGINGVSSGLGTPAFGGGAAGSSGNGSGITPGTGGGAGAAALTASGSGVTGNPPGGGGGGGASTSASAKNGGAGSLGQVKITYTPTSPTLTLSVATLSGFTTTTDAVSASQTVNISGVNLTNDIIVSPVTTNFEVSLSALSGYGSSVTIPFGSGTVPATLIYVRIKLGATAGSISESIIFTSTGATSQTLTASGLVTTNYYYDGSGSLADVTNWGTATNGTGTNPTDFITLAGQLFNIRNTASVATTAAWTVAGTGSKIIVGDASVAGVTLTVASGFAITTTSPAVLDITTASSGANSVILQDAVTTPSFGTLSASSEVHYQATFSTGTTRTFGKLFVDGSGTTTTFTGTPIVQTSLFVASGTTMATGNLSGNYLTINSGASVTINGTFQTQKSVGLVSSSVTTPGSGFATIQFIGTENLTLGTASSLVFNRASSGTAQTIDARTDYKNLTINGLDNNKTFAAGSLGISGALTIGMTVTATTGTSNLVVVSPLTLAQNSTIAIGTTVGTAVQTLNFADNSGTPWIVGKTLTITGWAGTQGASGTVAKIFFGSTSAALTTQQLSQIAFNISSINYTAAILSTGEIVPTNTVLPVSLLSFTGKKESNGVQLKWATASESNNMRFDILRAGTDRTFKKIGEVNGNGNSNAPLYYTFNDTNPLKGMNYYQLKQIDFDGKTQEYGPVAVSVNFNSESLQISSQPNQSEVLVFLNSNISKAIEINIYDLAGRNIINQKTNADAGINTFKLPAAVLNKGIHILKITSVDGTLIKKFTY